MRGFLIWYVALATLTLIASFIKGSQINITTNNVGVQNNYYTPLVGAFPEMADKVATDGGLETSLFRALITQESAWNAGVVSSAGAIGLGQVMPANARFCGKPDSVNATEFLLEPENNLRCAAKLLKEAIEYWQGDLRRALAEYNAGRNAVEKRNALVAFKETRLYVARVLAIRAGMLPVELCESMSCLRVKENAIAGNKTKPELFKLAQAIQSQVVGVIWFSSFDEKVKGRLGKEHEQGKAFDFTIVSHTLADDVVTKVMSLAGQLGLKVKVVNEYATRTGPAQTGGHIHIQL